MLTLAPPTQPELVTWQLQELEQCAADFWYWATKWVLIEDKETGKYVNFVPYASQRNIGDMLLAGRWPWVLKARRLGATVVVLLYVLWRSQFTPNHDSDVVSQRLDTANRLLHTYREMEASQPAWMRQKYARSNTTAIEYAVTGSSVTVTVGGERAARSEALNFLFVDEGAFVEDLNATLFAAEPTLSTSRPGISCVVSTSSGPATAFYAGYQAAKAGTSRYQAVFLDWSQRDGRDQAWYDAEAAAHTHQCGFMPREYPRDDVEAFQAAAGRVFPGFSADTHVVHCEKPDETQCYRAIDFGNSLWHPFITLWLWHDPFANPCLTFEPNCEHIFCSDGAVGQYPEGVAQMYAYRRDPKTGKLIKLHDDLPDALRYAATQWDMAGHVHVYRVLSIRCDDDLQMSPLEMFHRVQELSGLELVDPERNLWRENDDTERYAGTVCDRSGTGWIRVLREQHGPHGFGMDAEPYIKPEQFTRDEREQGIVWLSALILGKSPWEADEFLEKKQHERRRFEAGEPPRDLNEAARYDRWGSHREQPAGNRPFLYGYGKAR